jgi:hypothetical protein
MNEVPQHDRLSSNGFAKITRLRLHFLRPKSVAMCRAACFKTLSTFGTTPMESDNNVQAGLPDWAGPFLTEKQLAQRWQVSVKTLRNQRSAGIGCRYFKISGFVRYALQDVLELERHSLRLSTREKVCDV